MAAWQISGDVQEASLRIDPLLWSTGVNRNSAGHVIQVPYRSLSDQYDRARDEFISSIGATMVNRQGLPQSLNAFQHRSPHDRARELLNPMTKSHRVQMCFCDAETEMAVRVLRRSNTLSSGS